MPLGGCAQALHPARRRQEWPLPTLQLCQRSLLGRVAACAPICWVTRFGCTSTTKTTPAMPPSRCNRACFSAWSAPRPPWHRTPHSPYVRRAIRALEKRRLQPARRRPERAHGWPRAPASADGRLCAKTRPVAWSGYSPPRKRWASPIRRGQPVLNRLPSGRRGTPRPHLTPAGDHAPPPLGKKREHGKPSYWPSLPTTTEYRALARHVRRHLAPTARDEWPGSSARAIRWRSARGWAAVPARGRHSSSCCRDVPPNRALNNGVGPIAQHIVA